MIKNKILILVMLVISIGVKSQIAIGKETVSNASVSLEFGSNENRGIILPYITDKTTITIEGSTIYDTTDHKVKYLKDGGAWVNLSEDDGTKTTIGTADLSIQDIDKTEMSTAKMAIGTDVENDITNGILVLTDNDKAMILPKVGNAHTNIINPAPGMMVYDTSSKQLAIYNGTTWSFWKP